MNPLPPSPRPAQNWILDPVRDALFIIGTPLATLALAIATFAILGPERSPAWILTVFIVFNTAHHLPTFIRIYGDVDLFRRFRWSFVLGPLIPFTFALGVTSYINLRGYPIETFFYLIIILSLWDPWHFLMQHYGFVRIYDRPNAAPRPLAARMDFLFCATWFAWIMLATGDWLPGILRDLYAGSHVPLIFATTGAVLAWLERIARWATLAMTLVYAGYLVWCGRRGYFVSWAKLALCLVTFGVMFLTYTPNAWIERVAPGWTFQVGFAVLGMVHVTQYLAIVWRYNRSLARRDDRSRAGFFRSLHGRGGLLVGAGYVVLCLVYGKVLTTRLEHARWLMALVLSAGFTSTLMHYYFDGFIWKVRHAQNREALETPGNAAPASAPTAPALSWWTAVREISARAILLRQVVYFGLPMAALTLGAWMMWREPLIDPRPHVQRANELYRRREFPAALREAELGIAAMDRLLPLEQKIADLQPTAAHRAELALLRYQRSFFRELLVPLLRRTPSTAEQVARHRGEIEAAMRLLTLAAEQGGSLAHRGQETLTADDAFAVVGHWQDILDGVRLNSVEELPSGLLTQ